MKIKDDTNFIVANVIEMTIKKQYFFKILIHEIIFFVFLSKIFKSENE